MVLLFMNYEKNKPLDLNSALTLSEEIAKSKSPKAKFILDIFVNKSIRGYLNLSYAYLRWIDDYIDTAKNSLEEKKKFLDRQKFLFDKSLNGETIDYSYTEETFLFYFIQFAVEQKSELIINAVKNMIDTIEMDLLRLEADGMFSESEFDLYIEKQSKALYDIIVYFFLPKQYHHIRNTQGRFQARAFIMRDLIEDIDAGLINISREDIKKFDLNLSTIIAKKGLEAWIEKELNEILRMLIDEAKEAKLLPLKYKIFVYYSHLYYLPNIYRLKAARFSPLQIKNLGIFSNKFTVYIKTFIQGFKLFMIEFL